MINGFGVARLRLTDAPNATATWTQGSRGEPQRADVWRDIPRTRESQHMDQTTEHYRGRYLKLVERNGWEFATRHNPAVAVIIGWTDAEELVLVEQYREPVQTSVIELPAGLVGDLAEQVDETVMQAAERELLEETGYRANTFSEIIRCPTSAGMTDETVVFIEARGLERVGPGGGDASESISVHRVALDDIDAWLADAYRSGKAIDPKIFTALHWHRHPFQVRS